MDRDFDRPKRLLNLDPKLASYRRRRIRSSDHRVFRAAARVRGHALIVESEHDTVIPHAVIANYVRAFRRVASLRHEAIVGTDHGLSEKGRRHEWRALLVDWVVKTSLATEAA